MTTFATGIGKGLVKALSPFRGKCFTAPNFLSDFSFRNDVKFLSSNGRVTHKTLRSERSHFRAVPVLEVLSDFEYRSEEEKTLAEYETLPPAVVSGRLSPMVLVSKLGIVDEFTMAQWVETNTLIIMHKNLLYVTLNPPWTSLETRDCGERAGYGSTKKVSKPGDTCIVFDGKLTPITLKQVSRGKCHELILGLIEDQPFIYATLDKMPSVMKNAPEAQWEVVMQTVSSDGLLHNVVHITKFGNVYPETWKKWVREGAIIGASLPSLARRRGIDSRPDWVENALSSARQVLDTGAGAMIVPWTSYRGNTYDRTPDSFAGDGAVGWKMAKFITAAFERALVHDYIVDFTTTALAGHFVMAQLCRVVKPMDLIVPNRFERQDNLVSEIGMSELVVVHDCYNLETHTTEADYRHLTQMVYSMCERRFDRETHVVFYRGGDNFFDNFEFLFEVNNLKIASSGPLAEAFIENLDIGSLTGSDYSYDFQPYLRTEQQIEVEYDETYPGEPINLEGLGFNHLMANQLPRIADAGLSGEVEYSDGQSDVSEFSSSTTGALSDLISQLSSIIPSAPVEGDLINLTRDNLQTVRNRSFKVVSRSSILPSLPLQIGTAFEHCGTVITAKHVSGGFTRLRVDGTSYKLRGDSDHMDLAWYGGDLPVTRYPSVGEVCSVQCWDTSFQVVFTGKSNGNSLCFGSEFKTPVTGASGSPITGANGDLVGVYVAGKKFTKIKGVNTLCFSPDLSGTGRLCVDDLALATHGNGMYVVTGPTGSGKSTSFVAALVRKNRLLNDNRTIVIVEPLVSLTSSLCAQLSSAHGIKATFSNGNAANKIEGEVHVTTTQRLVLQLGKDETLASRLSCLVIDEAHYQQAEFMVIRRFASILSQRMRVVFATATPATFGCKVALDNTTPFPIETRFLEFKNKLFGARAPDMNELASICSHGKVWVRVPSSAVGKGVIDFLTKYFVDEKIKKKILFADRKQFDEKPEMVATVQRGKFDILVSTDVISVGFTMSGLDRGVIFPDKISVEKMGPVVAPSLHSLSDDEIVQAVGRLGRTGPGVVWRSNEKGLSYVEEEVVTQAYCQLRGLNIDVNIDPEIPWDNHPETRGKVIAWSPTKCKTIFDSELHSENAAWVSDDSGAVFPKYRKAASLHSGLAANSCLPSPDLVEHSIPLVKNRLDPSARSNNALSLNGPPLIEASDADKAQEWCEKFKASSCGTTSNCILLALGSFGALKACQIVSRSIELEVKEKRLLKITPPEKWAVETSEIVKKQMARWRSLRLYRWMPTKKQFVDCNKLLTLVGISQTLLDALNLSPDHLSEMQPGCGSVLRLEVFSSLCDDAPESTILCKLDTTLLSPVTAAKLRDNKTPFSSLVSAGDGMVLVTYPNGKRELLKDSDAENPRPSMAASALVVRVVSCNALFGPGYVAASVLDAVAPKSVPRELFTGLTAWSTIASICKQYDLKGTTTQWMFVVAVGLGSCAWKYAREPGTTPAHLWCKYALDLVGLKPGTCPLGRVTDAGISYLQWKEIVLKLITDYVKKLMDFGGFELPVWWPSLDQLRNDFKEYISTMFDEELPAEKKEGQPLPDLANRMSIVEPTVSVEALTDAPETVDSSVQNASVSVDHWLDRVTESALGVDSTIAMANCSDLVLQGVASLVGVDSSAARVCVLDFVEDVKSIAKDDFTALVQASKGDPLFSDKQGPVPVAVETSVAARVVTNVAELAVCSSLMLPKENDSAFCKAISHGTLGGAAVLLPRIVSQRASQDVCLFGSLVAVNSVTKLFTRGRKNLNRVENAGLYSQPLVYHQAKTLFHRNVHPVLMDQTIQRQASLRPSNGSFGMAVALNRLPSWILGTLEEAKKELNLFQMQLSSEGISATAAMTQAGTRMVPSTRGAVSGDPLLVALSAAAGGVPSCVAAALAYYYSDSLYWAERATCLTTSVKDGGLLRFCAALSSLGTGLVGKPNHENLSGFASVFLCSSPNRLKFLRAVDGGTALEPVLVPDIEEDQEAWIDWTGDTPVNPAPVPGHPHGSVARLKGMEDLLELSRRDMIGGGLMHAARHLQSPFCCSRVERFTSDAQYLGIFVNPSSRVYIDCGPYDDWKMSDNVQFFHALSLAGTYACDVVVRLPGQHRVVGFVVAALSTHFWSVEVCTSWIPRDAATHEVFVRARGNKGSFDKIHAGSKLAWFLRTLKVPQMPKIPFAWSNNFPSLLKVCETRWDFVKASLPKVLWEKFDGGSPSTYQPDRAYGFTPRSYTCGKIEYIGEVYPRPAPAKKCTAFYGLAEATAIQTLFGRLAKTKLRVPDQNEGYEQGIRKRWAGPAAPLSTEYIAWCLEFHDLISEAARGHVFSALDDEELAAALNGSSSCGTTSAFLGQIKKFKTDPKFLATVRSFERDIRYGFPVRELLYSLPKGNEKLPLNKPTRAIVCPPGEHRAGDMSNLKGLNDYALAGHGHPSSTSENRFTMAKRMREEWEGVCRRGKNPGIITRETSNWDSTQGFASQLLAKDLQDKWLSKGITDPKVHQYFRNRVKSLLCGAILKPNGEVCYKKDGMQITGSLDTSLNNKIGCTDSTFYIKSVVLGLGARELLIRDRDFNEGDDGLNMCCEITDEQWVECCKILTKLGMPPKDDTKVFRKLEEAPFCSHFNVEAVSKDGRKISVWMRDWDEMMEKFTRTVYNHGDNVSFRSISRAWSATLSLMASYWFLPEVRALHAVMVEALPKIEYQEIPQEDRRKLFELFGATNLNDLNVVSIMGKAGVPVSEEEIETFDLPDDVRERFGIWPLLTNNLESAIKTIKERLNKAENAPPEFVETIWSREIGDHPTVHYVNDDIDQVEAARLSGDVCPSYAKLRNSFRICKTPKLTLKIEEISDWKELAPMLRGARSLSALGFHGDLVQILFRGKLAMSRSKNNCAETFILEPGWLEDNKFLNPTVPVVSATQPANDNLGPDLLAREIDESVAPYGALVEIDKPVRWATKATFGGAVFSSKNRTQAFTLGQNARVFAALTWSKITGVKCSIADSINFPSPVACISSTSENELYPCTSSLATAGFPIPGCGKYSPVGMENKENPVCLRLSTNGPCVGTGNLRWKLVKEAQALGLDAGIYRLDTWPRTDSKTSPSQVAKTWEPLMKPKVNRQDYFKRDIVILADGFGAPYELHPLLHAGIKVILVGKQIQYCEAFCSRAFVKISDPSKLSEALRLVRALDPQEIKKSAQEATAAILRGDRVVIQDGKPIALHVE